MKELDNKFPLVSIIIPIYNVSEYIDRGIKNILQQNYPNFEILLVNDGSTDDSASLCDLWAQKDSRIRVFHKVNEGAGSARNVGILNALGKYIYFFDIDDYADADLLSYNVEIMETKEVDYILFGFRTITPHQNNLQDEVSFKEKEIRSNDELKEVYVDTFVLCRHGNGFPWNKFYRRSFLIEHNLLFENQRIQQDEVFNLNLYPYLDKAYISSRVLYTYYIYNKGNTRVRFIPDRFDIYVSVREHFDRLILHWQLKDNRLQSYLDQRFLAGMLTCCTYNLFHPANPWTYLEKKQEVLRILNHPISKKLLKNLEYKSFEERLYWNLVLKQDLVVLKVCISIFQLVRLIKNKLK